MLWAQLGSFVYMCRVGILVLAPLGQVTGEGVADTPFAQLPEGAEAWLMRSLRKPSSRASLNAQLQLISPRA